jgi:transposase
MFILGPAKEYAETVTGASRCGHSRFMAEQGCKWRGLPKRFGRWHTVYMRMNRWAKNGVLDRVFEQLQLEQIVRIRIEAFSLDSRQ